MNNKIEQGTILYGSRSKKYPENKCYSIIISARCDVFNNKIDKVYYLTAVDVNEWLYTQKGFEQVYKIELHNRIQNILKKQKINLEVLKNLKYEDREILFEKCADGEKRQVLDYLDIDNIEIRKKLIRENPKIAMKFLKEINQAKQYHYFFLPESAYLKNDARDKGLIVDFQEIDYYVWDEINKIASPGIDMMILNEESNVNKVERWKKIFWLEYENDFVDIEQTIISPWCELLMQRFAMDFIRIGVDGSNEKDLKKIIGRI